MINLIGDKRNSQSEILHGREQRLEIEDNRPTER